MEEKTRSLLCEIDNAITTIKSAFGAPGDHGYDTPQGKALYALYLLQADIANLLMEEDERALDMWASGEFERVWDAVISGELKPPARQSNSERLEQLERLRKKREAR